MHLAWEKQAMAGAGAGFRGLAEALVSGQQNAQSYVGRAVEMQVAWEKFRIALAEWRLE